MSRWLGLAFVIMMLDQGTKALALALLQYNEPIAVLPSVNFTLIYNTGAAFSFLANSHYARHFLTILAIVVSAGIIVVLFKRNLSFCSSVALAMILGGALGNVIDRFRFGYVIDFIDFYIGSYHWPTFNVADAAISIGALLLFIGSLKPTGRA